MVAVFEDDELAIAIGRNGHNIKLASKVTGYTIDAVKKSDYNSSNKKDILLSDIVGLSKSQVSNFSDNNINTTTDFFGSDKETILATKGVGEKTVIKITELINTYLNEMETKEE